MVVVAVWSRTITGRLASTITSSPSTAEICISKFRVVVRSAFMRTSVTEVVLNPMYDAVAVKDPAEIFKIL